MSDPFERPAYGRGKAILYRRDDGSLFIDSFAHGGITYELKAKGGDERLDEWDAGNDPGPIKPRPWAPLPARCRRSDKSLWRCPAVRRQGETVRFLTRSPPACATKTAR
jgi:hypothetical protein